MKIGWVDFSTEARKRAVEALDALEEPGAVDELGIGTLRDAFADAMFPGTSTIQTRAKYFVIVPCAIRHALENDETLRETERKCCQQMWETCGRSRRAGVIGNRGLNNGRAWIQRPPSEIYWAGMRTLGILRTRTPPGLWFSHARLLANEAGQRSGNKGKREDGIDDDRETAFSGWKCDFDFHVWKDIYPDFHARYKENELSPDLTSNESEFLRKRILEADATHGTLMAWCLENESIPTAEAPGDGNAPSMEDDSPFYRFTRSIRHRVPPKMGEIIDAANAFNRLVFPARVLHNKLLAVPGVNAAEYWDAIEDEVPGWAASVDLPSIFARFKERTPTPLADFLLKLKQNFQRGDFAAAALLVRKREKDIKGVRAKVLHPEKLEPGKWVGGDWLDYRSGIAGRILRDIANPDDGGNHA